MKLIFQVKNQRLYLLTVNKVVADSKNYLTAAFTFTDDWDGAVKVAQFTRGTTTTNVTIDASTGECVVPQSVLAGEGEFFVSVYGSINNEATIITANTIKIAVLPSGFIANPGTISQADAAALQAHADAVEAVTNSSTTGAGGYVHQIVFTVRNQSMYLTTRGKVVADSQGYLGAKFLFSDDWNDVIKIAQFKRDDLFFSIKLDANNECTVPWEVLVDEGVFIANVFGNNRPNAENKIITVNPVEVHVEKSGLTDGELPSNPTMGIDGSVLYEITQYTERAEIAATTATTASADALASAQDAENSATSASASAGTAASSAAAAANSATAAAASATIASNAAQTVENYASGFAPLTSPAFDGIPTAPTATAGTNTDQIATTAYVQAELEDYATLLDLNDYVEVSSADYIKSASVSGDTLTLTKGNDTTITYTPDIPTKVSDLTNDAGYATTTYTNTAIADAVAGLVDSAPATLDTLNELADALGNDPNFATTVATQIGTKAPLASPALTGTPTAPTPTADDNSTRIATTAYVQAELADFALTNDLGDYLPLSGGTLTGNIYTTPYYDATIESPEGGQTLIVSKGVSTKGTPPAEDEWHTLAMAVDSTGSTNNLHKYGQMETAVYANGKTESYLGVYKNEANSTTGAKIVIGYDANGNVYTAAPTPAAADNSTKIATTAFVNTKASNYLPLTGGTISGNLTVNGTVSGSTVASKTVAGTLSWSTVSEQQKLANISTLAFWNGAYDSTSSNLAYCNKGAFGTIVTKGVGDYASKLNLGKTENYERYCIFASAPDASVGNISATLLLTQAGNYGSGTQGAWLIQLSTRGGITMKVVTLIANTSGTIQFGYYTANNIHYFGFHMTAYRGSSEITIMGNAGFTLSKISDTATQPTGWTAVSPTSFANSSHSHSYLPLSGGTLSGTLAVSRSSSGHCFNSVLQGYSRGTAPSSTLYQTALVLTDQNEKRTGLIENTFNTDGGSYLCFRIYNNKGDTDGSAALIVGQRSDGNYYSTAPNPATTSNTNEIATTSWVNTKVASYLPLSGGTITGNLTFKGTANNISFQGTKNTYSMVRFIDNSGDANGNGISIGGGGAVIIGGGESATNMQDTIIGTANLRGGQETLALCNDGNVYVYTNCQNGASSSKEFTFGTNGVLTAPDGFSGNLSGNATTATTATNANSLNNLYTVSTRPTSANTCYTDGKLRTYLATSSMTTGKPPSDAHILHLAWDNGKYDSQIAVSSSGGNLYWRTQDNSDTWGSWQTAAKSGHTHNYAGSSSAGGAATSANKINTDAGTATNPVYFSNGVPVACTYSLNKTVPSDAKFTDTTYSAGTAAQLTTGTETATKVWSPKIIADFVKGTASLGTTGNVVLPNGLILKWGAVFSTTTSASTRSTTFSTAFPNACYAVLLGGRHGSSGSSNNISSISKTAFTVYGNGDGESTYSYKFYWLAIGS